MEYFKKLYITRLLAKIRHKPYESYVIQRIWDKLDDTRVQFVCQQYMRRGNKRYALADLYLPQLSLVIEINEAYHYTEEGNTIREIDLLRNEEITKIVRLEVRVIDCRTSLEELHRQIDNVVAEIKKMIDDLGADFIPWSPLVSQWTPEFHRQQKALKVDENPCVRTADDVARIFTTPPKKRGFLRAAAVAIPGKPDEIAWWPNTRHRLWANELSEDGMFIREYPKDESKREGHLEQWLAQNQRRVTFLKYKDDLGMDFYRFVGVFELNKDKSREENKCVWERISDTYELYQ